MKIFINLLEELPANQIVWKSEITLTAQQMILELESETNLGKQYISDLLRISRDFLIRKIT